MKNIIHNRLYAISLFISLVGISSRAMNLESFDESPCNGEDASFLQSIPFSYTIRINRSQTTQDYSEERYADTTNLSPALHVAACQGNLFVASLLIANGADVNFKDEKTKHQTPLHCAAARGFCKIVKKLLEEGADFKAVDANGKIPRQLAREAMPPKSIMCLLMTFCFPCYVIDMLYNPQRNYKETIYLLEAAENSSETMTI